MPIYEYQCQDCQHALEALQKISDEPLRQCPACGQNALRKKVSAAAFRLKGGGWYETDFKTANRKNLAGEHASEGKASDTGGKSGAQSDSGNRDSGNRDSGNKGDSGTGGKSETPSSAGKAAES